MKRILAGMLLVAAASGLCAETPIITQQPVSLTVTNSGPAVFNVGVSGAGPFGYQWQFNGTNLSPTVTKVAGASLELYPSYTIALLKSRSDIAVDGSGNLFISDVNRICKVMLLAARRHACLGCQQLELLDAQRAGF